MDNNGILLNGKMYRFVDGEGCDDCDLKEYCDMMEEKYKTEGICYIFDDLSPKTFKLDRDYKEINKQQ